MSPLQWALLIFAVIAVLAVYVLSRRDRKAMSLDEVPESTPRARQLDIFGAEGQQFDEFGVGKPRKVEPRFEQLIDSPDPVSAQPVPARGPTLNPEAIPKPVSTAKPPVASAAGPAVDSKPQVQKIVSLLIAQPTGQPIAGDELHAALNGQRLTFGARQIYHRMTRNEIVFSVASLLKPGHLDPAMAADFQTPGLTLFMVLPGPVRAADAIRDMIATADKLAVALGAEVYDAKKQPFTPTSARELQQDIESWARQHLPA
jgi:cell division protein ZipA